MRDSAPRILIVGRDAEQRAEVAKAMAAAGCQAEELTSIDELPQPTEVEISVVVADFHGLDANKLASVLGSISAPRSSSASSATSNNGRTPESLRKLAHDLRTPLNAILGWTQLLKFGDLDDRMKEEALDTIERSAKSQAEMISSMLDLPPA